MLMSPSGGKGTRLRARRSRVRVSAAPRMSDNFLSQLQLELTHRPYNVAALTAGDQTIVGLGAAEFEVVAAARGTVQFNLHLCSVRAQPCDVAAWLPTH